MVRRGGPVRASVLAALVLSGCGEAPGVPRPSPSSSVEGLAARLADPSFRSREEAEKALAALAPEHYEEIDRLRQSATDLEVQVRLDRVLSCPRILLSAAWLKAKKDGREDLVLGERWFRWEQEQQPVGYQRFEARREPAGLLSFAFEMETDVDGDHEHILVRYECTEDLRPLRLHAELTPAWGAETAVLDGEIQGEGWEIRRTLAEEGLLRIPWTSNDFPQEAALLLLPAWVRMGPAGREILHTDIQYPEMTLSRQVIRDEGNRRATLRGEGDKKPSCTIFLDEEGSIRTLQYVNNLKAERVSEAEGLKIRDALRSKTSP